MKILQIMIILGVLSLGCRIPAEFAMPSVPSPAMPQKPAEGMSPAPTDEARMVVCGTDTDYGLNLRGDAGTANPWISMLTEGQEVELLDFAPSEDGGTWAKVEAVESGLTGWVNVRYLCPRK